MQVLDNDKHPDGQYEKHRAGDLYDLIESDTTAARPVGEWNEVRIVKDGPHVEHWMNGRKIVDFELWTDEWNDLVAGSKFADWEGFAKYHSGKIALQDHGDWVAYRDIKIRPL
jgi:cytochrome c